VTRIELIPAVVFAALGVRSIVYWLRHRFASRDATDDVLFALFVTGRAGTWFAAAGIFWLYSTVDFQGRAFTEDASQYSWLAILFLALGAMQLIAAWFLSARGRADDEPDGSADA